MRVATATTAPPRPPEAHAAGAAAVPAPPGPRRLLRHGPGLAVAGVVLLLCLPPGSGSGPTAADAGCAVLVLWCAVRLLRERARPLSGRAALVLAAPAAGVTLAAVTSHDPAASLPGLVRHLEVFVLVPAAVVLLLRDRRDARLAAAAVVLLALVQGAVGVHQYATATGASYQGQDIRAVGTFGALDVMGMSTAVSYGVVVALAAGLAPPARAPRWLRPAALGCAALLLIPLALSFSRGSWIATALACAGVLLLAGARLALRTLAAVLCAAVVLVGGLGVGTQAIGERLGSITRVGDAPDQSVTDRYALWGAALGIWREAPLTGVGPKGFPDHRDTHAPLALSSGGDTAGAGSAFQRQPLLSPHNMYLLVLSEQGLIGLLTLGGSWAALAVCTLRRLRAARTGAPGTRASRAPRDLGLAAAGLLCWQLVDFLYADIGGPSTPLTGLVLGLAAWWALGPRQPTPALAHPRAEPAR
ncbi:MULTISPECIES: O-antigen ligase family protein [unclassified Streptomyces]|uniref:O-antigen ligase family protein n=1 Tax=unclassified Streptomyces TaxID=2593676 RepID=UPI0022B62985|nr:MULTISPECIES: O-antigen ligase family protein [unclassified Streptomyces]MCZ7413452.1 O-antigen ligase family protein [Streptomyces sp. WMMC897]MCZ7430446.1 O-antigen ligase family protein [Streptomyces sp. WMMC1477]